MHRVVEITKGEGWITQVVAGHQAKGVCMCVGGGLGDKHQRAPQKQHLLHDWSVQKKRAAGDKEQKRESKQGITQTRTASPEPRCFAPSSPMSLFSRFMLVRVPLTCHAKQKKPFRRWLPGVDDKGLGEGVEGEEVTHCNKGVGR